MEGFNKISIGRGLILSQSIGKGLICELVLTKSAQLGNLGGLGRGALNWFGWHFYLNQRLLYRHACIFPRFILHTFFIEIGIKSIWIDNAVQTHIIYWIFLLNFHIFIESDFHTRLWIGNKDGLFAEEHTFLSCQAWFVGIRTLKINQIN